METIEIQEKKFFSRKLTAEIIGVKPNTLKQWAWRKRGPDYIKVGRRAFYEESRISDWLDSLRIYSSIKQSQE